MIRNFTTPPQFKKQVMAVRKELIPTKRRRNVAELGMHIFPDNFKNMVKQSQNRMIKMFPDETVINFNGFEYLQSKKMLDRGIYICPVCGYFFPIEKDRCICGEEKFIILK